MNGLDDNGESPSGGKATPAHQELTEGWARETLEKLAFAALWEQRRARRWTLVFRFLMAILVVAIFLSYEAAHFMLCNIHIRTSRRNN
jgi:predicted nucleic acid-binding Zn ribbon protein